MKLTKFLKLRKFMSDGLKKEMAMFSFSKHAGEAFAHVLRQAQHDILIN